MELLSKEIIGQLKAAKAKREAATKVVEIEIVEEEVDETFDPIRNIEVFEDEPARGLFLASW